MGYEINCKQAVEVAVIDSGDCEAWHKARGIKITVYKEMVTLLSFGIGMCWIYLFRTFGMIVVADRCVRDTKRVAGMLVRFYFSVLTEFHRNF